MGVVDAGVVEHGDGVGGHLLEVVGAVRLVAAPGAAVVEGDDAVAQARARRCRSQPCLSAPRPWIISTRRRRRPAGDVVVDAAAVGALRTYGITSARPSRRPRQPVERRAGLRAAELVEHRADPLSTRSASSSSASGPRRRRGAAIAGPISIRADRDDTASSPSPPGRPARRCSTAGAEQAVDRTCPTRRGSSVPAERRSRAARRRAARRRPRRAGRAGRRGGGRGRRPGRCRDGRRSAPAGRSPRSASSGDPPLREAEAAGVDDDDAPARAPGSQLEAARRRSSSAAGAAAGGARRACRRGPSRRRPTSPASRLDARRGERLQRRHRRRQATCAGSSIDVTHQATCRAGRLRGRPSARRRAGRSPRTVRRPRTRSRAARSIRAVVGEAAAVQRLEHVVGDRRPEQPADQRATRQSGPTSGTGMRRPRRIAWSAVIAPLATTLTGSSRRRSAAATNARAHSTSSTTANGGSASTLNGTPACAAAGRAGSARAARARLPRRSAPTGDADAPADRRRRCARCRRACGRSRTSGRSSRRLVRAGRRAAGPAVDLDAAAHDDRLQRPALGGGAEDRGRRVVGERRAVAGWPG